MGTRSTAQQTLTPRHGSTTRKRLRGRPTSLRETLVAPLVRLWWLLALVAAAAGVVGYVVSGLRPPVYTATTTILFSDAGSGLRADDVERALSSRAQIAVSLPNLERVTATVPGTTTTALLQAVTVTPEPTAFGLRVVVTSASPVQAARVADAVVESFVVGEQSQAEAAANEVDETYDQRLADLDRQIKAQTLKVRPDAPNGVAANQLEQLQAERLRLVSEATDAVATAKESALDVADTGRTPVPVEPTSPRPVQDGIITALVALLVTAGILLERNRRAWGEVVDAVELSQAMGIPLLGEISTSASSQSGGAAALGLAVSRLRIAGGTDGGVFLLAPVVEGADGARAAHLLAEAASRTRWWPVALMHRALTFGGGWNGQDRGPGPLQPGSVVPVPYGSIESAESAITELRSRGALVVVEGPPARRGGDSSRLALAADGIIIVVADDQPVEAALDVAEILSMLPTPILGYVWMSTGGALTTSLPIIAPEQEAAAKAAVQKAAVQKAAVQKAAMQKAAVQKSAEQKKAKGRKGRPARDDAPPVQDGRGRGLLPGLTGALNLDLAPDDTADAAPTGPPSVPLGVPAAPRGAAAPVGAPARAPAAHPVGGPADLAWVSGAAPDGPVADTGGPRYAAPRTVSPPPFVVKPPAPQGGPERGAPRPRDAAPAGDAGRGAADPGWPAQGDSGRGGPRGPRA